MSNAIVSTRAFSGIGWAYKSIRFRKEFPPNTQCFLFYNGAYILTFRQKRRTVKWRPGVDRFRSNQTWPKHQFVSGLLFSIYQPLSWWLCLNKKRPMLVASAGD